MGDEGAIATSNHDTGMHAQMLVYMCVHRELAPKWKLSNLPHKAATLFLHQQRFRRPLRGGLPMLSLGSVCSLCSAENCKEAKLPENVAKHPNRTTSLRFSALCFTASACGCAGVFVLLQPCLRLCACAPFIECNETPPIVKRALFLFFLVWASVYVVTASDSGRTSGHRANGRKGREQQ